MSGRMGKAILELVKGDPAGRVVCFSGPVSTVHVPGQLCPASMCRPDSQNRWCPNFSIQSSTGSMHMLRQDFWTTTGVDSPMASSGLYLVREGRGGDLHFWASTLHHWASTAPPPPPTPHPPFFPYPKLEPPPYPPHPSELTDNVATLTSDIN